MQPFDLLQVIAVGAFIATISIVMLLVSLLLYHIVETFISCFGLYCVQIRAAIIHNRMQFVIKWTIPIQFIRTWLHWIWYGRAEEIGNRYMVWRGLLDWEIFDPKTLDSE